jgi:hypothetical protein
MKLSKNKNIIILISLLASFIFLVILIGLKINRNFKNTKGTISTRDATIEAQNNASFDSTLKGDNDSNTYPNTFKHNTYNSSITTNTVINPNMIGNNSGSLSTSDAIILQDQWLYFNISDQENTYNGIYRSMPDGSTGLQKLINGKVSFLNVVGQWIYYYSFRDKGVCRIKLNGTEKTLLFNLQVTNLIATEEYLYYTIGSKNSLYRSNSDGSNIMFIDNALCFTLTPDGEWLCYSKPNGGVFKMKTYAAIPEKLSDTELNPMFADNNTIYSVIPNATDDRSADNYLLSIKIEDGSANEQKLPSGSYSAISNGWLYYWAPDTAKGISDSATSYSINRVKIGKNQIEKLSAVSVFRDEIPLFILNNTVYYLNSFNFSKKPRFSIYRLDVDNRKETIGIPQYPITITLFRQKF